MKTNTIRNTRKNPPILTLIYGNDLSKYKIFRIGNVLKNPRTVKAFAILKWRAIYQTGDAPKFFSCFKGDCSYCTVYDKGNHCKGCPVIQNELTCYKDNHPFQNLIKVNNNKGVYEMIELLKNIKVPTKKEVQNNFNL